MGVALQNCQEEDPTFKIKTDPDTMQTIISEWASCILNFVERMKREFKVEANTESRSSLKKHQRSRSRRKVHRQSGGRGQYGHCWLRVEPQERQGL